MRNNTVKILVPAGIMLSYFTLVVVLAKRDKHKRGMFVGKAHLEEVAMKNKSELEEKHSRLKHSHGHGHGHTPTDVDQQSCSGSGSATSSLHYVNELLPNGEHRKKQRRHRQRHADAHGERPGRAPRASGATTEATVHRSGGAKRPSIRQKLFGQSIAHVKLVETQSDSMDSTGGTGGSGVPSEKRKRLQRMDTLPMPQVVRMSSAP
ncbi:Hypothetical predicted protein [Drosophila guanche]|uniref:Uncharacterized protein n=2 Tax=Drosophila guanche TaxID=7266 RepID=A0A3B0K803_DROGU|nr:Hypothetical predicted protein [Drosophila guanche]SPP90225.1 Hypothetical predicted protein [Drosophila guanche]